MSRAAFAIREMVKEFRNEKAIKKKYYNRHQCVDHPYVFFYFIHLLRFSSTRNLENDAQFKEKKTTNKGNLDFTNKLLPGQH